MTELVLQNHIVERLSLKQKSGEAQFDIEAGKKFTIKAGEEGKIFDEKVPEGKIWRVWMTVKVEEVDA